MSFDPVSFALGAASGGGGGGGGGGFTLLHGTYSWDGQAVSVTLPITASELYALMRTSTVAFDYTSGVEGDSSSFVDSIIHAEFFVEAGYADAYRFFCSDLITDGIEATDTVVFHDSGK